LHLVGILFPHITDSFAVFIASSK